MYTKLNQNKPFKMALAGLAVAMSFAFVLLLPFKEVAAVNALGSFFGGRIISFVPGYPWTLSYVSGVCPAHMIVLSYGAPFRGVMAVTIPPALPKSYYNYYTPGVSVKGAYYPVPLIPGAPISCPYEAAIPLFYSSLIGTSSIPG